VRHLQLLMLTALSFAVPTATSVQTGTGISDQDRAAAVEYLTTLRDQVLKESSTLTAAQWNFKAAPDRWSVGEVVHHLALAEPLLFDMQQKQASGPAATPEQLAAVKGKEAVIRKGVPDRTQKFQAPEPLQPGKDTNLTSQEDILAAFRERRTKTIDYASRTKDDLRTRIGESPVGPMDAYQWLVFIAAHSERHLAQLREVKADPGFPKGKPMNYLR
jgi:hypothetical protein